jgi:hypothetical protein
MRGGDGLKIHGSAANPSNNITVVNPKIWDNARGGITPQIGTYALRVIGGWIAANLAAQLDFEPGGVDADMPDGNYFLGVVLDGRLQGDTTSPAVSLSGAGPGVNTRRTFLTDCHIFGQLESVSFHKTTISGGSIVGPSGTPAVYFHQDCEDIFLTGGLQIYSPDHVGVYLETQSDAYPDGIHVLGCGIEAIGAVRINGGRNIRVANCILRARGTPVEGILWTGTVANSYAITAHDNTIRGFTRGIKADGESNALDRFQEWNNDIDSDQSGAIGVQVTGTVTNGRRGPDMFGSGIETQYTGALSSGLEWAGTGWASA